MPDLLPHGFTVRIEDLQGRGESFRLDDPDWNRKAIPESFGTKYNVGYDQMEFGMFRSDFRLFSTPHEQQVAKIIDVANQSVFEGRVLPLPKGTGKNTVKASGWMSHLSDLKSFPRIWIDQLIASWGGMPLLEQGRLGVAGYDFASLSFAAQNGALVCALPGQALPANVQAEAWYTAPSGALIGRVEYKGLDTSKPVGWPNAILDANVFVDKQDAGDDFYPMTLDNALRSIALVTARRQINIGMSSGGVAATPLPGANRTLSILRILGDHGYTSAQLTVTNVVRDILRFGAPLLTYDSDSIDENPTLVTQLVNDERDDPMTALQRANALVIWEAAVWNDRKFHHKTPKPLSRADWILDKRLGDTFTPSSQGSEQDLPFSGVWVVYNDVATNRTERVGPYGNGWGQDATGLTALLDTSDDNPCNQENQPRYAVLEISIALDRSNAAAIGALWLTENRLPSRAATGQAGPYVRNAAGDLMPSYLMRAGDRVRYAHDDSIFRLYTTDFKVLGGNNSLAFNDAPSTVEGLFERLGVRFAGVIQ